MLMSKEGFFRSVNYMIRTPDGKMFVTIMEDDDGKPFKIQINVGKAGYSLSAWSNALSRMIDRSLEFGVSLDALINELSEITSDKVVMDATYICRSGPEGVVIALMKYNQDKNLKEVEELEYESARQSRFRNT